MSFVDFSSWPREQEQSFVVYEQQNSTSQQKAWMVAAISAGIVFVAAVGIYFGVEPKHQDISKDMNMSNLTKKSDADAPAAPLPEKK